MNPGSKVIVVANDSSIETELLYNIKKNCHEKYHLITENNKDKMEEQIRKIFTNVKSEETLLKDEEIADTSVKPKLSVDEEMIINADVVVKKAMEPTKKISDDIPLKKSERH